MIEVDEDFAWDAAEGDRTREWWLDAHRRYFARQASRERCEFDDDVLTVFERFEGRVAARCHRSNRRGTLTVKSTD